MIDSISALERLPPTAEAENYDSVLNLLWLGVAKAVVFQLGFFGSVWKFCAVLLALYACLALWIVVLCSACWT